MNVARSLATLIKKQWLLLLSKIYYGIGDSFTAEILIWDE